MKYLSMPGALFIFILMILLNWLYAYLVQHQPDIIINAWSVLFPLITLFYFVFSTIACCGLYQRKLWGLRLASFMSLYGSMASGISMGLAFKLYPFVEEIFAMLLIFNLASVLYIGGYYYYLSKK